MIALVIMQIAFDVSVAARSISLLEKPHQGAGGSRIRVSSSSTRRSEVAAMLTASRIFRTCERVRKELRDGERGASADV